MLYYYTKAEYVMAEHPVSAYSVANTFIKFAKAIDKQLDPLKLQKLIYYAQGWFLANFDEPLIQEPIEAWPYGPVVPSIYFAFRIYGSGNIEDYAYDYSLESKSLITENNNPKVHKFLEQIWDIYFKYTGLELSKLTHQPNSAWSKAKENAPEFSRPIIDNKLIKEEFMHYLSVPA